MKESQQDDEQIKKLNKAKSAKKKRNRNGNRRKEVLVN